jgi:hypothetical protein
MAIPPIGSGPTDLMNPDLSAAAQQQNLTTSEYGMQRDRPTNDRREAIPTQGHCGCLIPGVQWENLCVSRQYTASALARLGDDLARVAEVVIEEAACRVAEAAATPKVIQLRPSKSPHDFPPVAA